MWKSIHSKSLKSEIRRKLIYISLKGTLGLTILEGDGIEKKHKYI